MDLENNSRCCEKLAEKRGEQDGGNGPGIGLDSFSFCFGAKIQMCQIGKIYGIESDEWRSPLFDAKNAKQIGQINEIESDRF